MKVKKEEIIEAEFYVVDDDNKIDGIYERHIWVLVGESIVDAKLAKVSMRIFDVEKHKKTFNCYVSQLEGVDIEDAYNWRVCESFNEIPTKDEQKEMVKKSLLRQGLSGEIYLVGERYAEGHKAVLKLQKRIKGGVYVSV